MNLVDNIKELVYFLFFFFIGAFLLKLIIKILIIDPINEYRTRRIFEKKLVPMIQEELKKTKK